MPHIHINQITNDIRKWLFFIIFWLRAGLQERLEADVRKQKRPKKLERKINTFAIAFYKDVHVVFCVAIWTNLGKAIGSFLVTF